MIYGSWEFSLTRIEEARLIGFPFNLSFFNTLRMYKFPAKKQIRRSGKFKELSISATTALQSHECSAVAEFSLHEKGLSLLH
jgi:hypothetical protein